MFFRFAVVTTVGILAALAQTSTPIVRTQQGDVVGTQVSPSVRRFLGIPYAVANRWEAPRPPPYHQNPLIAASFGDSCPQAIGPVSLEFARLTGSDNLTFTESEDCLSLNIWAPSLRRKQKTAVMIWVYGGGFLEGTSNSPAYDGQTFVHHEDILVVTLNYRINMIGQPNAPQLIDNSKSQNFGFLDTDAAIQWVYDNIAAFGGDPERIILFGQSAGGVTNDAYTFAHPNNTRVKGVIMESGTLGSPSTGAAAPLNGTLDPTSWNTVSSAVGCGNTTDAAQLMCMTAVPWKTLVDVGLNTSSTFYPVADGITIFGDTRARAEAGNFSKIPVLLGNNAREGDIYSLALQNTALGYSIPLLAELTGDVTGQTFFACPTAQTANDRARANVPVWRYEYQAIFPDISLYPGLRAYHGSEIPIVWGTFKHPGTKEEVALSKYMQLAWVAFARDPVNGLNAYGWPQYQGPTSTTLVELGGFYNKTGISLTKGELVDFTCNATDTLWAIQEQLNSLLKR